jgi:hypothetical protein
VKKVILSCLVVLVLVAIPFTVFAEKAVKVEIFYMNKGPLQPTLEELRKIFSQYGSKITVSWYEFDTKEADELKKQKGLKRLTPLAMWINGNSTIPVNGKNIEFIGFPDGTGPALFQGKWTMEDFRTALEQIVKNSK